MQTKQTGRIRSGDALLGVMLAAAALGAAAGTAAYCFIVRRDPEQLRQLALAFIYPGGPAAAFIDSFCVVSAFVLCEFLLGFCSVGQPVEVAVPAVFGLGSGAVMCSVCSLTELPQGIAPLLPLVCCMVLSAFAVAAAACESVKLSSRLMSHVMSPLATSGMLDTVRLYCGRFLAAEVICAAAAALRALSVYVS